MKLLYQCLVGRNGRPSGRRLTGMWFVILTTLVVFAGIHNIYVCRDLPTNYVYFLLIMVTVVMLYGLVITFDKIIGLIKAIRKIKDDEEV